MEEGKILSLFGVLVLVLFAISGGFKPGNAINATDEATIQVGINMKTMVDISPDNMSFGTLDPGTRSNNYTNTGLGAGVSKSGFQLENIGSTNITNLWLNVTQPTARPFGTGNSQNYDAANFVAVNINDSPDGSAIVQNTLSFVDRLEYNASTELIYLNLPSNTITHGRFRSGYNEFFWAVNGTGGSSCNASSYGSGLTFIIGLDAHNQTETGTIDLVSGNVARVTLAAMYESGMNTNWSYSTTAPNYFTVDTPASDYCVAVYEDCSRIRLFRWNADAPGAGLCGLSGAGQVYNSTNNYMYPGHSLSMNIELRIPYGTAMGAIKDGYLTVVGQSAEAA